MISIDRVMYLYHYFIPLQFSLILAFLVFVYLFEEHIKNRSLKLFIPMALILFVVVKTFLFFSPLSYYGKLTADQFKAREWSSLWGMKHVE
jgi:dolichyl-phosphate-mannose-protein mannosyltransferase